MNNISACPFTTQALTFARSPNHPAPRASSQAVTTGVSVPESQRKVILPRKACTKAWSLSTRDKACLRMRLSEPLSSAAHSSAGDAPAPAAAHMHVTTEHAGVCAHTATIHRTLTSRARPSCNPALNRIARGGLRMVCGRCMQGKDIAGGAHA